MENEVRNKKIEVRVTQVEKDKIIKKSEKAGLTVSEYLRRSALEKEVKSRFSEEELEAWHNLTYISQSLKNLNNLLSKDKRPLLIYEIQEINKKLKIEIEKFF